MARELGRRLVATLLLVLLLLGATACFQASVGLEVAEDGSGQLVVDLVPSDALLATVGGNLPAFAEQLQAAAAAQSSGAVARATDTPRGQALHLELPFTDVQALTADAGSATGGVTGALLGGVVQRLQVTRTGGTWSMVAVIDPGATQGGLLASPLAANPALAVAPSVTFSVTLPGRVESTNATSQRGGTATWTLRTDGSGPQTLKMVNTDVPVLPYVLAALGTALALVVAATLVRRWRRRRVQAALRDEVRAAAAANVVASATTTAWEPASSATEPAVAGPAQGWYPDPAGTPQLRWWDGNGWTDHLHDPPE